MGLSTALYRRSLLSVDSVDLLPSSRYVISTCRLSWFLLTLVSFAHVRLLSRCIPMNFTSGVPTPNPYRTDLIAQGDLFCFTLVLPIDVAMKFH
jgi:hypothetical protein